MSDHSSTESDDMTAEDQNLRNLETDDMHSILGSFMDAKEETLEELVGGLMFLTMEDVRNSSHSVIAAASKGKMLCTSTAHTELIMGDNKDTERVSKGKEQAAEHTRAEAGNTSVGLTGGSPDYKCEDIEEEILEEDTSTRQAGEDALFRHRPASLTKFDNFVESGEDTCPDPDSEKTREGEEGQVEEEEDWLPTSGYMASFDTGNAAAAENPPRVTGGLVPETECSDHIIPQPQQTGPLGSTQDHLPSAATHVTAAVPSSTPVSDPHLADPECDETSEDCAGDVEAPSWALNPGEVEEESSELCVQHKISVMEFSTSAVSHTDTSESGQNCSQVPEENCSDEVVPFQLDAEFDYDSVVLVPKFSQAEMKYLTSFLPDSS